MIIVNELVLIFSFIQIVMYAAKVYKKSVSEVSLQRN